MVDLILYLFIYIYVLLAPLSYACQLYCHVFQYPVLHLLHLGTNRQVQYESSPRGLLGLQIREVHDPTSVECPRA